MEFSPISVTQPGQPRRLQGTGGKHINRFRRQSEDAPLRQAGHGLMNHVADRRNETGRSIEGRMPMRQS